MKILEARDIIISNFREFVTPHDSTLAEKFAEAILSIIEEYEPECDDLLYTADEVLPFDYESLNDSDEMIEMIDESSEETGKYLIQNSNAIYSANHYVQKVVC